MNSSLMLENYPSTERKMSSVSYTRTTSAEFELQKLCRAEPVDVKTVILTIKHLKNTNSAGSDGMTLRYL